MVEILSESTAYRDLIQKKKLYAKFGVKEYWIVVPEEKTIDIYNLKDKAYILYKSYSKDATLESMSLRGFRIELKNIFK